MPRNLVLCLDGTSNRYKKDNTNVLKLFAMLDRSRDDQIVYYEPGVGTITPIGVYGRVTRAILRVLDLAFAILLKNYVCDAYRFLMATYQPGDRIYIYGFSRGAYTARVLAGMIHMVGLLPPHNDAMVPFAWNLFKKTPDDPEKWEHVFRFRKIFGARGPLPRIEMLGLWDTVSSVRYLWWDVNFAFTANNPSVGHVRHAVALDERRAYFRQNLWKKDAEDQDVVQLWFAGVHCDVGGGYVASESGLANVALKWMKEESASLQFPVHFDSERVRHYLPTADTADIVSPNPLADRHESLKWYWWPLELLPKSYRYRDATGTWKTAWRIPLGTRRFLGEAPYADESVKRRIDGGKLDGSLLPPGTIFVGDEGRFRRISCSD